ncbi:MAG: hypothetical protein ACRDJP_06565, partial [Actinomycetota bacterium]
ELIGVERDDVTFRISIHETADVAAAHSFWSRVVDKPVTRFYRPTLKVHPTRTVRKNTGDSYHGCLTVGVRRSTDLNTRIEGWFRGISEALELRDSADLPQGAPATVSFLHHTGTDSGVV